MNVAPPIIKLQKATVSPEEEQEILDFIFEVLFEFTGLPNVVEGLTIPGV